jgi:hypothetical protein
MTETKFSNPLADKRHELNVDRMNGSNFLGKSMFWRHIGKIHKKYIYRTASVEYRTLKLMLNESFLICLVTIFFTITAALIYTAPIDSSAIMNAKTLGRYSDRVSNISGLWDWLSEDFVPQIFSHSEAGFATGGVTPPEDWLLYSAAQSTQHIKDFGIFSLNNYPGFAPQITGAEPFSSNILLGPVRLRQYAVSSVTGSEIVSKNSGSSNYSSTFTWLPSNVTQQSAIYSQSRGEWYPGSGFVYDFKASKDETQTALVALRDASWIDDTTRAVFCELSQVNTRVGVVLNSVIVFELDESGRVSGSFVETTPVILPPNGVPASFVMTVGTFACFTAFTFFLINLLLIVGPVDFFTYAWNLFDLVLVTLYYVYTWRLLAESAATIPSILAPISSSLQSVFRPYSIYIEPIKDERSLAAVIAVLVWMRLIKPLCLIRPFRTVVKVFERFVWNICFMAIPLVAIASIFAGIFTSMYSFSPFFQTWTTSFYSVFFMYMHALDVSEIISPAMLAAYLLIMWFIVPGCCIAIALHTYRTYKAEQAEAEKLLAKDRLALFPPGINPRSWWHQDVVTVFIYTWFTRIKGIELFKEPEEDIGYPEEQVVELKLLPLVLQTRWAEKRAELMEIMEAKSLKPKNSLLAITGSQIGQRMSKIASTLSKTQTRIIARIQSWTNRKSLPAGTAKISNTCITRVQLQRLLDTEPDLAELLRPDQVSTPTGSSPSPSPSSPSSDIYPEIPRVRAIDVIRKYSTPAAASKAAILDSLLSGVSQREDVNGNDVQTGLRDITRDLELVWKERIAEVMELVAALTEDLMAIQKISTRRSSTSSRHSN